MITNPPFGSKIPIKDKDILEQFDLAHVWENDKDSNTWKMTPYVIESVLSKPEDVGSPDRSKKIGAYSFVKDDVKISRAIVVVLYMLRCCLAHGDFSPDEASNNVYKYAYEVLCIPLKKLR